MRALVFLLALIFANPSYAAGWVGAYGWGKYTGAANFYSMMDQALHQGFTAVRVQVGPDNWADNYGISPDPCTSTQTLACNMQVLLNSSVWDNAGLQHLMITAYDYTCKNADPTNWCMTTPVLTANTAAIKAEYKAMFDVIRTRFATSNPSLQVILSNWEGDNFIYCGSAYSFATTPGWAATCKASWGTGQTNAQRVQAFLAWMAVRDAAIAEYKALYPSFNIIQAPEGVATVLFDGGCLGQCSAATDTLIAQIGLAGGRAYCSYSSYDMQSTTSSWATNVTNRLLPACTNVIVGEFGYAPGSASLSDQIWLWYQADVVRNMAGVIGVIPWNANGWNSAPYYAGVWDNTGIRTQYNYLQPAMRPTPQASPVYR